MPEPEEVEFDEEEEETEGDGSDPTMTLATAFADDSQWDKVVRRVPIFKEHEAVDKDGRVKYKIDAGKLKAIADAINENWRKHGKPLKLFLGHTKDPKTTPQSQQPPLVGFGKDAVVGRYGPARELAILTDWFIKPGWLEKVKEFPERSPEFYPNKGEITAVALLKTDPRLSMGMVTYGRRDHAETYERSDGAVLYQRGFDMPVMDDKVQDPTKLPDEEPEQVEDDVSDDDVKKFMKYMAGCMKKYMAVPSGTNGAMPGSDPASPPAPMDGEPEKMQRGELAAQYQALRIKHEKQEARLRAIEKERKQERIDYARTTAANMVNTLIIREHVKIKDPKKAIEKLAACETDAQRLEMVNDWRENYAREEDAASMDPAREEQIDLRLMTAKGFLPSFDGPVERAGADAPQMSDADIEAAVTYAEENHLDTTRDSDWAKAMEYVASKKKKVA